MFGQPVAEVRLGRVAGLDITATPLAGVGTVGMTILFAVLGRHVFKRPLGRALLGGFVLAMLHWGAEVWHNAGHNTAARTTGYPMTGTRLGFLGFLGESLYPPDEPELPPSVHIRRALGGPIGSAVLSVIAAFVALVTAPFSFGWVTLLFFLDNLFVFTLGAWVPLGFNDVSTVIHWRRRRAEAA
ncbi:MAG: hypothetical protein QOE92_2137 [Chloroflexota bacterium]|nr:hypothetical protein [Chloroflexota bacterium]